MDMGGKMKFLAGLISILTIFLTGCSIGTSNTPNNEVVEQVYTTNGLFNINKSYELIYANNGTEMVIDKNVTSFKSNNDYLAYAQSESGEDTGYILTVLNLITNEKEITKHISFDSYMIDNSSLYFVSDYNVINLDLNSKEEKTVYKTSTNDIFFHDLKNNSLAISHIKTGVPTVVIIDTTNNKIIHEFKSIGTDYVLNGDCVYGIDDNYNMFRLDTNNEKEVVNGIQMLKFELYKDMIVYIDTNSRLNVLDIKGSNRHLTSNVVDFTVFGDDIYYITSVDNKLYKINAKGVNTEVIFENTLQDLYLYKIK